MAQTWTCPWLFLGHTFPHFLLSQKTTRITGAPTQQSRLVRCGGGEFLFIFQNVEILSDAEQERALQLAFLLEPRDLIFVQSEELFRVFVWETTVKFTLICAMEWH